MAQPKARKFLKTKQQKKQTKKTNKISENIKSFKRRRKTNFLTHRRDLKMLAVWTFKLMVISSDYSILFSGFFCPGLTTNIIAGSVCGSALISFIRKVLECVYVCVLTVCSLQGVCEATHSLFVTLVCVCCCILSDASWQRHLVVSVGTVCAHTIFSRTQVDND